MRKISDTINTDVTADYPDGGIRDKAGAISGTPLLESLYHDSVQAWQKLMRLAGISYNSIPDNETNGYQALDALYHVIDRREKYSSIIETTGWAPNYDVNDLIIPGFYLCKPTGVEVNMPESGYPDFLLQVVADTVSSEKIQRAVTIATKREYYRIYDGTWSAWIETTPYTVSVVDSSVVFASGGEAEKVDATIIAKSSSATNYNVRLPIRLAWHKRFVIKNDSNVYNGNIIVQKSDLTTLFTLKPQQTIEIINTATSSDWEILSVSNSEEVNNWRVGTTDSYKTIREKVIAFTGWNMDTSVSLNISHGLDINKIIGFTAFISPGPIGSGSLQEFSAKADLSVIPPLFADTINGEVSAGSINILLRRLGGGYFDQAVFNNASGYVIIKYLAE